MPIAVRLAGYAPQLVVDVETGKTICANCLETVFEFSSAPENRNEGFLRVLMEKTKTACMTHVCHQKKS